MDIILPKIEIKYKDKELTLERLKIIRSNLMTQFENEVENFYVGIYTDAEDQSELTIRFSNHDSWLTTWVISNVEMTMKIWK